MKTLSPNILSLPLIRSRRFNPSFFTPFPPYGRPLCIEQAITNLRGHARIVSIAMDRGFMDGKLLWWLNREGIIFYIPAKSNQHVYNDAISLVETGLRDTRETGKNTGHGKNSKQVINTWDVVGIEGLNTAGFYSELGGLVLASPT